MKNTHLIHLICTVLIYIILPGKVSASSLCTAPQFNNIIYVDKGVIDGNKDGTNWENAYKNLDNALEAASLSDGGDQIWIAKGNYFPKNNTLNSFNLPSNSIIIGGFSGKESSIEERDLSSNITTLSGNKLTQHLMLASGVDSVSINGITIHGGKATGSIEEDSLDTDNQVRGGGLLAFDSNLKLCNVVFAENRAKTFGGAIYQSGGTLHIENSRFLNNSVLRGEFEVHDDISEADTDGGAIALHDADLYITKTRFLNNIAGDDGGAIAVRRANVFINRGYFKNNKGIGKVLPGSLPIVTDDFITSIGGGVSIENESVGGNRSKNVNIKNSIFIGNKSAIAGALYILGAPGSITNLKGLSFIHNGGNGKADINAPANEQGVMFGKGAGAVLITGLRGADRETDSLGSFTRPLHKVIIEKSKFKYNEGGYGGALVSIASETTIKHTTFSQNSARTRGGAIWSQNFIALFDQIGGLEPDLGNIRIDKSLFFKNRSLGVLETLQAEAFLGIATIEEQTFGGGAISNSQSGILSISNSRFISNSSINSDGAAIHNATSPITFFSNALMPPAPATYPSKLTVINSVFLDNKIIGMGSGGAIANGGNQVNGKIADPIGNDLRNGAASSSVSLKNNLFLSNRASNVGGAMVNWHGTKSEIIKSRFIHNSANDNGGAIASIGNEKNSTTIFIDKSVVVQNNAIAGKGGGVFARYSEGEISRSNFSSNTPNDITDETDTLNIQ